NFRSNRPKSASTTAPKPKASISSKRSEGSPTQKDEERRTLSPAAFPGLLLRVTAPTKGSDTIVWSCAALRFEQAIGNVRDERIKFGLLVCQFRRSSRQTTDLLSQCIGVFSVLHVTQKLHRLDEGIGWLNNIVADIIESFQQRR